MELENSGGSAGGASPAGSFRIDEAMRQASQLDGPICLLDMGDNVGGGSPADGTELAHALRHQSAAAPAFVCLYDPDAVQQAAAAGVERRIPMRVGGKTDRSTWPTVRSGVHRRAACTMADSRSRSRGTAAS